MEKIYNFKGKNIWIVEDNSLVASGLQELLERKGAKVKLFKNPQDHITPLLAPSPRGTPPDLIISECLFLDRSPMGDPTAMMIHTANNLSIPVILHTSCPDQFKEYTQRFGNTSAVTKQASSQVLFDAIDFALSHQLIADRRGSAMEL